MTGANRGIGLAYCQQLHLRGDRVIAVCRQSSDELDDLGVQVESGIELTSPDSLAALVNGLAGQKLDTVILNAGILESMGLSDLDPEAIRRQFEVNALAPLLLARALTPLMPEGSKLVLMTSRMGSIEDNNSGGSYGYRMSKVALNIAGKSLAVDLRSRGIAVAILHPGLVKTRMVQFNPNGISPEDSVRGLIARIDELTLNNSGSFLHANGSVLPW